MPCHASPRSALRGHTLALVVLLGLSSCVDAPAAPDDLPNPFAPGFVLAPAFSLVGPGGSEVHSRGQADALDEAFDRVNRFRFVVRRASNSEVVLDTIVSVSPGDDEYDFSFGVTAAPNEQFRVTLTAFEGETELFEADDITVQAAPATPGATRAATPTNIALQYSGPGATATSVQISPAHLVLAPGDAGTFSGDVQDAEGNSVSGVPLGWSSSAEIVATVDGGALTAGSDGFTEVVVTTPTGLEARAFAYVVGGVLAYVKDGALLVRGAAGGDAETRGGDARAPAWSPDGARLYYVSGGAVRLTGSDEALVGGDWPSVSPDGTKLAVDDGGVVFVNTDGSNPTPGPAGSMPVWDGDATLLVAGGSVERVAATGGGRTTVAGGSATAPARSPGGDVAYVDGGELRVAGRAGALASGVEGRPSWSPDGTWLVIVSGGGLFVAPANGGAPGAPLPGLEGAAHPAFQPAGALTSPPALSLTGMDPDPAVPGQPVDLLGAGFDVIIPDNNIVTWPTPTGVEETGGVATETRLSTRMPRVVSAGQIRVDTRTSTAVLDFVPVLGAIEVHAQTRDGTPVPGLLGVVFSADNVEVARGETDDEGTLLLPGLTPATYTLDLQPPDGFSILGAARHTLDVGVAASLVEVVLRPRIDAVDVTPRDPSLAVGERVEVTLVALDRNGRPITSFESSFWGAGSQHLAAGGGGLSGVIVGVAPTSSEGEASYNVRLNDQLFSFSATVTSRITGKVTVPAPSSAPGLGLAASDPGRGVEVRIKGPGVSRSTVTDDRGTYSFDGLLAGTYTVEVVPPEELFALVPSRTIALSTSNPTGTADFELSSASDGGLATDFRVLLLGNSSTTDNAVHEYFSSAWPDIEFVIHDGQTSTPSLALLTSFDVVFLYENGVYSNAKNVGDAVAGYVNAGGNVVFSTFYWQDRSDGGWHPEGWGALESVDPFVGRVESDGHAGSEYRPDDLDPSSIVPHVVTEGVNAIYVHSYHGGVLEKEDATVLARWSDGVPLVGYRIESKGQRLIGVTAFPGYLTSIWSSGYSGDLPRLFENAIRWAGAGSTPAPPPAGFRAEPLPARDDQSVHDSKHHAGSGAGCSANARDGPRPKQGVCHR